jgi:RNAse (barnase) inhibitor barstar
MNITDDGTMFKIAWQLERPIEKYAGVSSPLGILGFNDKSEDIKKYTNPSYLMERVKIGFMPDRVVFVVDDKIISTLSVMGMNEEAYSKFEAQDKGYFVKMFKSETEQGLKRMKGQLPPKTSFIEKKASYEGINQIFERANIHPVIYFLVLTRKYTADWITWEPAALINVLEKDFGLKEGVADIPLNKILSIQVANKSDAAYVQHHAFEKVIRSFNNKPVDFLTRQTGDMTMEDLAFGLDMLEQVTPHDDIYDNFSDNVMDHMVDILVAEESKLYYPMSITGTKLEQDFVKELNVRLLDANNENDLLNINDNAIESKTIQENELIHNIGIDILKKLKQMKEQYKNIDDEQFVDVMVGKINMPIEVYLKELIKKQVLRNVEMDEFLSEQRTLLKQQMTELAL